MKIQISYTIDSIKLQLFIVGIIFSCFGVIYPLHAQKKKPASDSDSIKIEGNSFVILGDTTILIRNDTSFIFNDSLIKPLEGRSYQKSDEFYNNLKSEFYKNKLTKEIFDLLFKQTSPKSSVMVRETENSFIRYEGKLIGNTIIQKLDVFGPEIRDTTRQARSWLERTGNAIHMTTREHVIQKNLLYEKGDRVDALLLADNERIIRELPFIKDARIYITPRKNNRDTVDILVLTKDVWSLSFDLNSAGFDGARFSIDENNLFGVGHELENAIILSSKWPQEFGYEGKYIIPNINGTFVNGQVFYSNTYFKKGYGLLLSREFITPEIKWGGGIELAYLDLRERLTIQDDSTQIFITSSHNLSDFWIVRAFIPDLIYLDDEHRSRIVVGGRMQKRNFLETPEVRADTNQLYHDRTMYIGSIGYFRQRYYRDILVYGYGRTEDIPYGSLIELTTGVERGEYFTRPYSAIRVAKGGVIKKLGYVYGNISFGSYFRHGEPEQGIIRFDARYFSNLIWYKQFKFRQFFYLNYTRGVRRFDYEFININGDRGLRGISDIAFRGTSRFAINMETVAFTPYDLLGFNFAIFGFADMGIINSGNQSVFKGDSYYGFGLGLRFRNENLTFNTFQIRFALYPNAPSGPNLGFNISGLPDLRLNDFYIQKPSIIDFD